MVLLEPQDKFKMVTVVPISFIIVLGLYILGIVILMFIIKEEMLDILKQNRKAVNVFRKCIEPVIYILNKLILIINLIKSHLFKFLNIRYYCYYYQDICV